MDILKIYLNIYLFKVFKPTQLNRIFPVCVYIYFFNEVCISPKLKEIDISGLWHFVAYTVSQPPNPPPPGDRLYGRNRDANPCSFDLLRSLGRRAKPHDHLSDELCSSTFVR